LDFPLGVFPLNVGAHEPDDGVPGSDGVVEGSDGVVEGSDGVKDGSPDGVVEGSDGVVEGSDGVKDGSPDGVGSAAGNDGAGLVDGRPRPVGNVIVPSVTARSWSCEEP
jgi:hypothetical protein